MSLYDIMTGNPEWYTPPHIIEKARRVLGSIDLDPASCEAAQAVVKATRWHSKEDDGLAHDWAGRVWMNPPYNAGVIGRFIEKLVSHYEHPSGGVTAAILLTNYCAETAWFRLAASRSSSICTPKKRLQFVNRFGQPSTGQPMASALFYFGPDRNLFEAEFGDIGYFTHFQKLRECGRCGRTIPSNRRSDARYCSTRCRVAAHRCNGCEALAVAAGAS